MSLIYIISDFLAANVHHHKRTHMFIVSRMKTKYFLGDFRMQERIEIRIKQLLSPSMQEQKDELY